MSSAVEKLRHRKSADASDPEAETVSRKPRFLELPVYFRDQGGENAKFAKINTVWVGSDWTMLQVREFLVESKRADTKHIFDWLPDKFRFFHPDQEVEIAKDDESAVFHSSFKKSFIAVQSRVLTNPKSPLKVEETPAAAAATRQPHSTSPHSTDGKSTSRKRRSVSSDVSMEADSSS